MHIEWVSGDGEIDDDMVRGKKIKKRFFLMFIVVKIKKNMERSLKL